MTSRRARLPAGDNAGQVRCPRTLLARFTPATRCPRRPAVGRPGRIQPPCGRGRARCRQSPSSPASGPAVPVLAPVCRARQHPAHAAAVAAESLSLARKCVQTEVPSGLAASSFGGSRHRHPEAHCRCSAHPWQETGRSGASAAPTHQPCECRLPAGLTERDGIGIEDSGSAPDVCAKGLDHWSSEYGAASAIPGL